MEDLETTAATGLGTGHSARPFTVALAGQPNVGKSTIFNLLTGLDQHVGNWPGKTVEKREGTYTSDGVTLRIVDLPGTYGLTATRAEERIARDFLIKERPDVVVVIADAAALERNLYLLAELLALPVPVVLGLNMVDVAEREATHVEPHVLEAALGLPVVPMVARKNKGVRELMAVVEQVVRQARPYAPNRPGIRRDHEAELDTLRGLLAGHVPPPYPEQWVALKLLEGDEEITALMAERLPPEQWHQAQAILMRHEDGVVAVASGRYEWIGRMVRAALTRPRVGQVTMTERLDRVATHPVWGLVLLLGLLGVVFWSTYAIGSPLQEQLDTLIVHDGSHWVRTTLTWLPPWVSKLLAEGVIGGAGMVVTLLPILLIFFGAFAVLEDVGYMTRAAYVMDRFMHPIGLHGKSFLPLCLGFGCNVPAVMGARIIGVPRRRLFTILLTPLVPCTARLAVIAVLAPIFFPHHAALVVWGLVTLNVAVLSVFGMALHKPVIGRGQLPFIMEMPLYHVPNLQTIGHSVWRRMTAFLRNAGSIIVIGAIVVWALSNLPSGDVETSYLAGLGHVLSPLGALMGLDWRMMMALLSSFVAKENALATIGVLYAIGDTGQSLSQILQGSLTPAAALAFMVVQMLFIPCLATVATMRAELGTWKWILAEVAVLLVGSFIMGIAVYRVGQMLGLG